MSTILETCKIWYDDVLESQNQHMTDETLLAIGKFAAEKGFKTLTDAVIKQMANQNCYCSIGYTKLTANGEQTFKALSARRG